MASLVGGIHLSTSVSRNKISFVTGFFILSHTAEREQAINRFTIIKPYIVKL